AIVHDAVCLHHSVSAIHVLQLALLALFHLVRRGGPTHRGSDVHAAHAHVQVLDGGRAAQHVLHHLDAEARGLRGAGRQHRSSVAARVRPAAPLHHDGLRHRMLWKPRRRHPCK
ncbi:unnamed protein product, partial [Ixodes pacificus]